MFNSLFVFWLLYRTWHPTEPQKSEIFGAASQEGGGASPALKPQKSEIFGVLWVAKQPSTIFGVQW